MPRRHHLGVQFRDIMSKRNGNDTAKRMAEAVEAFLDSLQPEQKSKAQLVFSNERERRNWHYIPRDRLGLPLKEMDGAQRAMAHRLVASGLSSGVYARAQTIIQLETVLAELEGPKRRFSRDPDLYFVSVFGAPVSDEPWGWRFEGHHISLNFTIVDGRLTASTPIFLGANPAHVRHGEMKGTRVLREEEDLARDLLASLDKEQKEIAIVNDEAPPDILTRNLPRVQDEVVPEGLSAEAMTRLQREVLEALINVYVTRLPEELAVHEGKKLQDADPLAIHFAWAGKQQRGKGHYYRLQGQNFLAEYDNTQNDANHIHAVWRDLENDFGDDLLQRHYQQGHVQSALGHRH